VWLLSSHPARANRVIDSLLIPRATDGEAGSRVTCTDEIRTLGRKTARINLAERFEFSLCYSTILPCDGERFSVGETAPAEDKLWNSSSPSSR
jgi:hypothetical protein